MVLVREGGGKGLLVPVMRSQSHSGLLRSLPLTSTSRNERSASTASSIMTSGHRCKISTRSSFRIVSKSVITVAVAVSLGRQKCGSVTGRASLAPEDNLN